MGRNKLDAINFCRLIDLFGEKAAKDTLRDVNEGRISERVIERHLYNDEPKSTYECRLRKELQAEIKKGYH